MLVTITGSIGFLMMLIGAAGCGGGQVLLPGMISIAGTVLLLIAAKEDGKIRRKRRHGNRRKGLCAVRRFR